MKKKTIYIGGAISGLPLNETRVKFKRKEQELINSGCAVINPLEEVEKVGMQNDDWDAIMRYCVTMLMGCDELHLLPCWQRSKGATLEREVATRLDMPIVYS